jgi:hypothetical protein
MPFPNLRLLIQPNRSNTMSQHEEKLEAALATLGPQKSTASLLDIDFPNVEPTPVSGSGLQEFTPLPERGIPSARPAQAKPQLGKKEFIELDEEDIAALKEMARGRREATECQSFLDAHKEYVPNPEDWETMSAYLDTHRLPIDRSSIEEAYSVLTTAGMLQPARVPPRPASHFSTGLSANGAHAPAIEREMTQADLSAKIASMPIEEARQWIARQMYLANQGKR